MKGWPVLVICLTVLLSACHRAAPEPVAPVTTGFSCEAEVRYKEMHLSATLTRDTAGTLTLAFTAPDTLKGVTAAWNGQTVTATLYGLRFDLPPDTLPAGALGSALTDALDAVTRSPLNGTVTGAALTWNGTGQNGAITLTADPEDGSLLKLEMPDVPLTATFSQFKAAA